MNEEAEAIETAEEPAEQPEASQPVPIGAAIHEARFGYIDGNRGRFGLRITFRRGETAVGHYVVADHPIEVTPDENADWSEESRDSQYADAVRQLNRILRVAGKEHVAELQGTPVQLHIDGNQIVDWRVFWEVL